MSRTNEDVLKTFLARLRVASPNCYVSEAFSKEEMDPADLQSICQELISLGYEAKIERKAGGLNLLAKGTYA